MKNVIAIIFDFDDTLARDSITDLVTAYGLDGEAFWRVGNQALLDQGWDPVPAYMRQLIQLSRSQPRGGEITQKRLAQAGGSVRYFEGVETLFGRLRSYCAGLDQDFYPEFYLISSGLGELLRATSVAGQMRQIFASDFEYDEEGRIDFPKRVVSFTDKTRHIFQISKGLVGEAHLARPFEVNAKVPESELRIPISHMIYLGDGFTDVPCFSLLNKGRGTALAVYDKHNAEKRARAWSFIEEGRVRNLHSADYSPGSDLLTSIEMAIGSIIQRERRASSI